MINDSNNVLGKEASICIKNKNNYVQLLYIPETRVTMHQERYLFYYQTEVMDNDLPAVATGLMLTSNYHQLCQLALPETEK